MSWLPLDTWIVVIGMLSAVACALLGNFLVLRNMSMMGDAISHAVLPGLAIAFIITGRRASVAMFIGAAVVGVLTAVLTQFISQVGKVESGASMGIVFTSLFAVGLILIRQAADHVDLDPGCVLYGALEYVAMDVAWTLRLGDFAMGVPRAALVLVPIVLINAAFVAFFFKELRISSFDPALATTLGINANLMHYLLMTLVAVTTVASFEVVGSIIVIAMLIVPPATAHLLTDRLSVMIVLSVCFALVSAALGHVMALTVPGWFGFDGTTTSGMIAVASGLLFMVVALVAPRYGVLARFIRRAHGVDAPEPETERGAA